MKVNNYAINIINKTLIYAFFVVLTFVVLYPIAFCISGAFSPGNNITSLNVLPFTNGFTLEHFEHLFKETSYFDSCSDSVFFFKTVIGSDVTISKLRCLANILYPVATIF